MTTPNESVRQQERVSRRAALTGGEVFHGAWLMSDSRDLARIASSAGFDYVCLDMQHGYVRADSVLPLSDAVRAGGDALVAARVPANRFAEMGMLGDAGVEAIIVPLVSSVEQAREAVAAVDYPDAGGRRSWGPTESIMLGSDWSAEHARPLLFLMIENAEGLAAVEEIVAVDGVDGIYIGPSDLAFGLGSRPGPEEQVTADAIARVLAATQVAGKIPGIHTGGGAEAAKRREQGFRFITTSTDVSAARRALAEDLAAGRGDSGADSSAAY